MRAPWNRKPESDAARIERRWNQESLIALRRAYMKTSGQPARFSAVLDKRTTEFDYFGDGPIHEYFGTLPLWVTDEEASPLIIELRFSEGDDCLDSKTNTDRIGYCVFGYSSENGGTSPALSLTVRQRKEFNESTAQLYVESKTMLAAGIIVTWSVKLDLMMKLDATELWGVAENHLEDRFKSREVSPLPGFEPVFIENIGFQLVA